MNKTELPVDEKSETVVPAATRTGELLERIRRRNEKIRSGIPAVRIRSAIVRVHKDDKPHSS